MLKSMPLTAKLYCLSLLGLSVLLHLHRPCVLFTHTFYWCCVQSIFARYTQNAWHWVGGGTCLNSCCPLLLLLSGLPSIRVFPSELALHIRWPNIGASASASVLPMNIQDWFPLGLTGLIPLQSKGLSRVLTHWFKHYMFSLEAWYLFLGYERNVFC